MTRKEAENLIAQIRSDQISPHRTKHVLERFWNREYFAHDLRAIIRCHQHMSAPRWDEDHQNFVVELHGKCLTEGRDTVVVLGLRLDGICTYITIMPELEFMRNRARRS